MQALKAATRHVNMRRQVNMTRAELANLVLNDYFAALDKGDVATCTNCFADDAILECKTNNMHLVGHSEIGAFFTRITNNTRSMVHTVSRLVIDLDERTCAAELSYSNERIEGDPIDTSVCDLFEFNSDWKMTRVCFWTGDVVVPAGRPA
jgi:ketosteroid isomerase-like protein